LVDIKQRLNRERNGQKHDEDIRAYYVRVVEIFGIFVSVLSIVMIAANAAIQIPASDNPWATFYHALAVVSPAGIILIVFIIILEFMLFWRGRRLRIS
jgi:sterol desaturase/sphingolipid hydroxylase (fatty acid hydroxylase superfamily)